MRKISVSLRCRGVSDESATHTFQYSRVPTPQEGAECHAHLESVPDHPGPPEAAPTAADCHLQIWELDFFEVNRNLAGEETDSSDVRNQRIASIPGVVMIENRRAVFRPIGEPTLARTAVDPDLGKVILGLTPLGETEQRTYEIPLPEFETIFELGAAIRPSATDDAFGESRNISPYKVRNLRASLRHQIAERGGITVAFVADYREPDGSLLREEVAFTAQGEQCLQNLPAFVGSGDTVTMAYHLTNDWHTMAGHIDAARAAAGRFLGVSSAPKVATLLIYCHGGPSALKLVYTGPGNGHPDFLAANSLRSRNVNAFVDAIRPHVADDLVLTMFACSAGRGYTAGEERLQDDLHGRPYPCEHVGADSLGWLFLRELQRRGIPRPTVWAHATAGHTTHNSWLRVFSHLGTTDLVNFLAENRRVAAGVMNSFKMNFAYFRQSGDTFRTRLHNANFLRAISLARAVDLPWSAVGSPDPSTSSPGYHAEPRREADHNLTELRSIGGSFATEQDEVVYSQSNTFITGARSGVTNPALSANFRLSDLTGLDAALKPDPFRIKVELMKASQLIRDRSRRPITILRIAEDGSGLVVTSNNDRNFTAVSEKARQLVEQGLLTAAGVSGEEIHLSHSGLRYSDDFEYIVGRLDDDRFEEPLLTNSPSPIRFSEVERVLAGGRINRRLVQIVHELGRHPDVNQQLTFENLEDQGDTVYVYSSRVAQVVAAAQELIEAGRLRSAEATDAEELVRLSMV